MAVAKSNIAKYIQGPPDAVGIPVPAVPTDLSGNVISFGSGFMPVNVGGQFAPSDGFSNSSAQLWNTSNGFGSGLPVVGNYLFNGFNWDRQRSNAGSTLLSSAARTTTQTIADQQLYNALGALLFISVTLAGTGSITPSLQIKDPASGDYLTIWTAAAAIVANGDYGYLFYPAAASALTWKESLQTHLAATFRWTITANNANPMTYSVGQVLLV